MSSLIARKLQSQVKQSQASFYRIKWKVYLTIQVAPDCRRFADARAVLSLRSAADEPVR